MLPAADKHTLHVQLAVQHQKIHGFHDHEESLPTGECQRDENAECGVAQRWVLHVLTERTAIPRVPTLPAVDTTLRFPGR